MWWTWTKRSWSSWRVQSMTWFTALALKHTKLRLMIARSIHIWYYSQKKRRFTTCPLIKQRFLPWEKPWPQWDIFCNIETDHELVAVPTITFSQTWTSSQVWLNTLRQWTINISLYYHTHTNTFAKYGIITRQAGAQTMWE